MLTNSQNFVFNISDAEILNGLASFEFKEYSKCLCTLALIFNKTDLEIMSVIEYVYPDE